PSCRDVWNPVLHVLECGRIEAGAADDFRRIGSELSQQRGEFDKASDPLSPGIRRPRRLTASALPHRSIDTMHLLKHAGWCLELSIRRAPPPGSIHDRTIADGCASILLTTLACEQLRNGVSGVLRCVGS